MQGMCTRACVLAERVEAAPGRSTPWNGRRRIPGAPLSGLRMGHGGLCRMRAVPAAGLFPSSPCRTVAGCGSAMQPLPVVGGLAGTTRPTAAAAGMAGLPAGAGKPQSAFLCENRGGGEFPGRCGRPAGSGGGRSAGRQATTPAAEGLSPAGHPCPGHQGARPPPPEGAPVPQPRVPEAAPACGLAAPARTPRPQPGYRSGHRVRAAADARHGLPNTPEHPDRTGTCTQGIQKIPLSPLPGLAMPGRGDGRASGAPAHNQGRILAAGAAGSASGMGFVVKAGRCPAFFFFCCRDRFPPKADGPACPCRMDWEQGPWSRSAGIE